MKELEERLGQPNEGNVFPSYQQPDSFLEKEAFYSQQVCDLERQVLTLEQQVDSQHSNHYQLEHLEHLDQLEQQVIQLQQQQPNWERQITEIIDWVGNEKEARNYLQQMAAGMTKEVDALKQRHLHHPPPQHLATKQQLQSQSNSNYTTWQERRSARVEKQELLQLQFELANEIEDKQRVQSELARVQRELNTVVSDLSDTKQEMLKIQDLQNKRQSYQSNTNAPSILFSATSQQQSKVDVSAPLETSLDSEGSDLESEDISSASNRSGTLSHPKHHSFMIRTFVAPLKCNHCTSLMVGLIRQGLVCEACGFACHVACADQGVQMCPCDDARQRPVGIDPQRGIGTAYEGYVKIPKSRGGVRKGWIRMFVVVCDFKLFLYDLNSNNEMSALSGGMHGMGSSSDGASGLSVTPFVSVNTLIDMR